MVNAEKLEFNVRSEFGKKSAHKLRKEGKVPCTVTSNTEGALHYFIEAKEAEKLTKCNNFFAKPIKISTLVKGKKATLEIIPVKIDFHPVNDTILHIDFSHITSEEISLLVPVKIIGADKASGLKKGGKLNLVKYHLPLKSDVKSIPKEIEINISTFGIGKSLFLSNLVLPKNVKMQYDCLILSITGRGKKEKDETPAQGAEGASTKQESKKETK